MRRYLNESTETIVNRKSWRHNGIGTGTSSHNPIDRTRPVP